MKIKLTYFKRSGKLYSTGEYETTREHMFEIYREVAEMRARGELPDLMPGCTEFVVLVEAPDHRHNAPQLIGADDASDILQELLKLGPRHDHQLSEPTAEDQRRWAAWDEAYAELFERARRVGVIE